MRVSDLPPEVDQGWPEPPVVLIDAIRLALGDVDDRHVLIRVDVHEQDWIDEEDPDARAWWVDLDPGGFGATVRASGPCETFVDVAARLQDYLGDDADPYSWGPYCGVHEHPAVAECVGDEARWCCPRTGSVVSGDRYDRTRPGDRCHAERSGDAPEDPLAARVAQVEEILLRQLTAYTSDAATGAALGSSSVVITTSQRHRDVALRRRGK